MLYSWLHLVALIVYIGAIVGFWFMLLPSAAILQKHEERVRYLARGLKFYNPLQIGGLGVILFSGAFQLTELKAAYREMFMKHFAVPLGMKLLFAFFLVLASVYQALGVGHRFVKRVEGGDEIKADEYTAVVQRLRGANWLILFFGTITFWLGMRLRQ
jgi:uncharacterized membrane protein